MTIDLEEFLAGSGIDMRTMEHWFARDWIMQFQAEDARPRIPELDAARAIFIRDLKLDFGVNDEGIEIVLHLVDQLHGLRRAMLALHTETVKRPG